MKNWAKSLLAVLAFLCLAQVQAAEIPNTSVFSQTDASNNTGTCPSWAEAMAPSAVNDSARCLQGALTREWNWNHPTITSGGAANVQTLTYSVAPAAYYNGQRFCFEAGFSTSGSSTLNVNTLGAIAIKYIVAGSLTDTTSNTIRAGDRPCVTYRSTGPSFVIENPSPSSATAASTTEVLTGTDASKYTTPDSIAALWEKGSDIASNSTISIGEGGFFHVTGTTTITDIDFATATNGRCAWLEFDGALTLTHHSTTLVLPTGANITTVAGDTARVCQDNGDNVHVIAYNRKSGQAVGGAPTESLCVAASDETSNLTTGTAKVTFRMPYAFTVTAVRMSVNTAATGANLLTVDINEAGTTIISTKLTTDASEKTSTTAATPPVISDSSLADDAEMTVDIDQIGNTIAGKGLKVCIIGRQT